MKNARRLSQAVFLLAFLFLFIQTETRGNDELGYPVKLFLDFDPLVMTTTLLSAHAVTKAFLLSLVIVAATVVFGRVFCGWVCPLGTLNNMAGSLRKKSNLPRQRNWHSCKYLILIFLLGASLFSVQLAGLLDPVSLLIRSLSLSVYPMFSYGVRAAFDALYNIDLLRAAAISEPVYEVMKKTVLPFQQPFYRQALFIGAIFSIVLGLNLLERRFWCRYLCPLGALLGILSRFSFLRRSVSEGCTECGACAAVCQGNAAPDRKGQWRSAECYYCWNCDDICPEKAVNFGFSGRRQSAGLDLGRRRVVASVAFGAIAAPILRATPLRKPAFSAAGLIRPPGSLSEEEFLRRCVRCGECMKVCLTNGLQPTLLEAGLEGIWSPVLVPAIGYCEYRCTLCGQVCPTGAIRRLEIAEKTKVKIGLAMIDKGRCLPYAHATPCIVCEEVCPTPKKAIWFETAAVKDRQGRAVTLKQPRVDLELCIGCGICETKCPVLGKPAIYVLSVGESRSKENRLLL